MEREEREHHDIENRRRDQYEKDYGHSEGPLPNPNRQPRSQIVASARGHDAAQVGDNDDDMAITTFPALAPRLRSVAYPNNFKPNIQKYDGHSDPNIWLSTYYIAVKVAGGSFDHMAAYFPLVMGEPPSLWLNNLPAFFKLLKKSNKFKWTDEADQELEELKTFLTTPLVMVPPAPMETLLLYIFTFTQVVSAVLVAERPEEGHQYPIQRPVYYVSEVLSDSKVRYSQPQKLLYVILVTSCKLRYYFQSHKIKVVSSSPLGEILRTPWYASSSGQWSWANSTSVFPTAGHQVLDPRRFRL
jgi:hypothetical protein